MSANPQEKQGSMCRHDNAGECAYCHGCEDGFDDVVVLHQYVSGTMRHANRRHVEDRRAGVLEPIMVAQIVA